MRPHGADIDDRATRTVGDHARDHGLGEKEQRVVQIEIRVVELGVVVQERFWDEESGRVDHQRCVAVVLS